MEVMSIKPKYYMQTDPKWRYSDYSAPGEKKTIGAAGCGPTCAAMVLQTLRPDKKVTPKTTAKWSKAHGFKIKNQGTAYTYFKKQFEAYGLSCVQLNAVNAYHNSKAQCHAKAKQALKDGYFVIAVMGPGNWTKAGHYVLAYRIDSNGHVYINDPASKAANRTKNQWSTFKHEVKYYWVIKYGAKCKTVKVGNLYSHRDVLRGKKASLKKGDTIYHIKDMKDGWSIASDGDVVGYAKNTIINKPGITGYRRIAVNHNCNLYSKNRLKSKKIKPIKKNQVVQVITRRKFWSNVIFTGQRGYIRTKFLK